MNNEIIEVLVARITELEKRIEYLETVEKNVFSTVTVDGTATITGQPTLGSSTTSTKIEGAVKILERPSALTDTATYGQLWVKSTNPNELWFTDGDGTDTQLA